MGGRIESTAWLLSGKSIPNSIPYLANRNHIKYIVYIDIFVHDCIPQTLMRCLSIRALRLFVELADHIHGKYVKYASSRGQHHAICARYGSRIRLIFIILYAYYAILSVLFLCPIVIAFFQTGTLTLCINWRLPATWRTYRFHYAVEIIENYASFVNDVVACIALDSFMILIFVHMPFLAQLIVVDIEDFNVKLAKPVKKGGRMNDANVLQTMRDIIANQLEFDEYVCYLLSMVFFSCSYE